MHRLTRMVLRCRGNLQKQKILQKVLDVLFENMKSDLCLPWYNQFLYIYNQQADLRSEKCRNFIEAIKDALSSKGNFQLLLEFLQSMDRYLMESNISTQD